MTDANSTPKVKRHQWLDAAGNVVADVEQATGIRYTTDAGEIFDYQVGSEPGLPQTMLAAFGARTLATNTVSSFYGAADKVTRERPRKDDAPENDIVGLQERFAAIVSGDWGASVGGGTGGTGYNLDDLCDAAESVITAAGAPFNKERIADALRNGGRFKGADLDAKAYRNAIYNVAGVKEAYQALRAAKRPATSVDEVADEFG
jgi:hypothetical protein